MTDFFQRLSLQAMKHLLAVIIMFSVSLSAVVNGFNNVSPIGNCPGCRKFDVNTFEPLKRVAIIKAEILRRLGISQQPSTETSPQSKTATVQQDRRQKTVGKNEADTNIQADDTRELSEILSYSEIPENFTDEHILQFKVAGGNGQHILVKSANLVVRVKYKQKPVKEQRSSSREKRKRKRRQKTVDLMIFSVNTDGKPGTRLASIKSKLRKTKWLRLNLPQDVVQKAVDSDSKTLQVYVKCEGCDRRARLILARKGRKRRNLVSSNENKSRKLHKRRPILYLHTQVKPEVRYRRSTHVSDCSNTNNTICSCHKMQFVVDFKEFGWDWIISPKHFKTAVCVNVCTNTNGQLNHLIAPVLSDNSIYKGLKNRTSDKYTTNKCAPLEYRTLRLLYYDHDGKIQTAALPDMIVRNCGCKT